MKSTTPTRDKQSSINTGLYKLVSERLKELKKISDKPTVDEILDALNWQDNELFKKQTRTTRPDELILLAEKCECSVDYLLGLCTQPERQDSTLATNPISNSTYSMDQSQLIEELLVADLIANEDVFRIGEPHLYGVPQYEYYNECVDKETARKILESADADEDVPIPGVLLFYNSDASGWIRSYLELKSGLRIAINGIQTDQDRYILARKYIREKITQRNVDENKLSNPDGGKSNES